MVPTQPISLMKKVYREVFPIVHRELAVWKQKAEEIPNEELRKQALASIQSKTFHCEGGSILALLSEGKMEECIRFIVAYQTISDYLDNLCDRSTSLDPVDFRSLHDSMPDALRPGQPTKNYYQFREEQDDGGADDRDLVLLEPVPRDLAGRTAGADLLVLWSGRRNGALS